MSASFGGAADKAADLPKPATRGGLVVPLAALVRGVQRDLGRANAASQAAAWPAGLAAIGWPAPSFRIGMLELSLPCLVRKGRGAQSVLELVSDAAAGRTRRRRRLVVSLAWSVAGGAWLRAVRLDPVGTGPGRAREEER